MVVCGEFVQRRGGVMRSHSLIWLWISSDSEMRNNVLAPPISRSSKHGVIMRALDDDFIG